jgi:hypothetical protein
MKSILKFINNGKDQRFTDALVKLMLIEIRLKSGSINEDMILPADSGNCVYDGVIYRKSDIIKIRLSKQTLSELQNIVLIGSEMAFENVAQVKNWLISLGINSGAFSV